MLTKRIIACLDVKNDQVVKGVQFRQHRVVGDILQLAKRYSDAGIDELVFYDITASSDRRSVKRQWVSDVAKLINIPFCVAGGIKTLQDAEAILNAGADKISINSPALENPNFIDELVAVFGQQCVVVGIDSLQQDDTYKVYQYTGDERYTKQAGLTTSEWVREVQARGAGEIVLNCMNCDGMREGYDITQLTRIREITQIPLIASGGAGSSDHFLQVFTQAHVDGGLAASIFHNGTIAVADLKAYLHAHNVEVRL